MSIELDFSISPEKLINIVEATIKSRSSTRAFLDLPVSFDVIERILETASFAPSGSNMQPWKVRVLTGAAKTRLINAVSKLHNEGNTGQSDYKYYPDPFPEPYLSRRRATGWGLYGMLGIEKGQKQEMHHQQGRNFCFFDAPVGMIFTIDRVMEIGSWLDYGTFLQNIMILAQSHGLNTCPQAAWANYHSVIRELFEVSQDEVVVCGMALGYKNENEIINTFQPNREPVASFTKFIDE